MRLLAVSSLIVASALAITPAGAGAQGAGHATPAPPAGPASDRAAVLAVVRGLFDAMRAGDSAKVRAAFHPDAQLATAGGRAGAPGVTFDSLGKFVRAVGTPHPDVWDERLRNEVVHLDGPLAVVWTEYSFYAGSRFSHCGVDAFQLARMRAGWKIIALTDTRRRTGCPDQLSR